MNKTTEKIINSMKEQLIVLYNQGKSDVEIAKKLNVSISAIFYWRKKLNLKSKFTYSKISKINNEKFKELFNKGLSDYKIAKELNVSPDGVYSYRMRHGYFRKSLKINNSIELSNYQKEVLIGTMLGDGWLGIGKECVNPRFRTAHCVTQKEYSEHLIKIFNNLHWKCSYHKYKNPDKRTGKYYESYVVESPNNPALLYFYNLFYKNGKKVIPIELLDDFTEVSLAFMFMDDGFKTKSGYQIATNCFTIEELDKFRIMLKLKFNIETTLHKSKELYIPSKSKDTFTNLIKPYIIPCMQYKLHNK